MQSFQERFKAKSSTIGKSGELDVNPDRAVGKPKALQIHSPVIKSSGRTIVEQNSQYDRYPVNKVPNSASPSRKAVSPKRQFSQAPPISFMSPLEEIPSIPVKYNDFKPYTIQDYNSIKPAKYYQLGGLGPANVGTDDWIRRKNVNDKRNDYGKKVIKAKRERVLTDSGLEIVEKNKSHSVIHERHSSAFT